jgi:hypothetical protein
MGAAQPSIIRIASIWVFQFRRSLLRQVKKWMRIKVCRFITLSLSLARVCFAGDKEKKSQPHKSSSRHTFVSFCHVAVGEA